MHPRNHANMWKNHPLNPAKSLAFKGWMPVLVGIVCLWAGMGSLVQAQKWATASRVGVGDAASKEVLKKMSKKYRSMKSMQAQVTVEMQGGAQQATEKRRGKLFLRGRKFRIDLGDQLIVSDGRNSWTYLKETNEVSISLYEPSPDQITPDNLFTMYEKGFDSYLDQEKAGSGQSKMYLIDLVPHNKKVSYFKVRLFVHAASSLIHKAVVFDKSGMQYTYQITDFKANPKLKEDVFAFNPKAYPGVEVVDMR